MIKLNKSDALYIVGAGGHGRVVADIAEIYGVDNISFLDKNWPQQTNNLHWPIVGANTEGLIRGDQLSFAIGSNRNRELAALSCVAKGFKYPTMIHPGAHVSKHSSIGPGTVIMAGAVVNISVQIGSFAIINTSASIDHDCILSDYVHVSPGAHLAGSVTVGKGSWIGLGAVIREGCRIGSGVMVAAGAVVVKDVADFAKVQGIPAKVMDR